MLGRELSQISADPCWGSAREETAAGPVFEISCRFLAGPWARCFGFGSKRGPFWSPAETLRPSQSVLEHLLPRCFASKSGPFWSPAGSFSIFLLGGSDCPTQPQDGPRLLNIPLRWPIDSQHDPKLAQHSSNMPQHSTKVAQDGPT